MVALPSQIRVKSVLAATDFSATSQKAVGHALAIAQHYGAKFCLAHVVSSPVTTVERSDAINAATDTARSRASQLENQLLASGALKGLRYEVLVRHGDVWDELDKLIRQKEVDLLVIGTRGRRGIRKLLLGSVAEQIFHRAACPVLTVGPGCYQESRVGNIVPNTIYLFPTDFDEASLSALPHAVSYANQVRAKLALLHVVRSHPAPGSFLRTAIPEQLKELTLGTTMKVQPEFIAEFGPVGPVSSKILQTAGKLRADLIFMGLRRFTHPDVASHRPWTTAYDVVCGAECPVVTIRV